MARYHWCLRTYYQKAVASLPSSAPDVFASCAGGGAGCGNVEPASLSTIAAQCVNDAIGGGTSEKIAASGAEKLCQLMPRTNGTGRRLHVEVDFRAAVVSRERLRGLGADCEATGDCLR